MEIVFERRYRGPLASANGGYASGRLAELVDAPEVEVTLRLPPPLVRALEVRPTADCGVTLLDGEAVVAEARPSEVELSPPPPVSRADAADAVTRHVRIGSEVFRECFTCGIREERDGLEIYAGAVAGRHPLHAAPWTAHDATPAVVWAAIDCPGAYAVGVLGFYGIHNGYEPVNPLLAQLGPHTTGVACVYVKRLDDIDIEVLERLVTDAWRVAHPSGHR